MKTLKQIFAERYINVRAFAKANGMKPTTLQSILDGKTKPQGIGIRSWFKIAHGLGMTADELIEVVFGDDIPDA